MLRITPVSQSEEEVVLKIEGAVADQDVALLEEEGRRWLGQTQRLLLDLEGVHLIDRAGLDLLEHWHEEGVRLRGGSLFVRTLLQRRGLIQGPDPSPQ